MNKIFILSFFLVINLVARENPFEPTNAFKEEKARLMEIQEENESKEKILITPKITIEEPTPIDDNISIEKIYLPFVHVKYSDEMFEINSKYSVTKRVVLPNKKKMILDYDAKEDFYTIREDLKSLNFQKIAIGNHDKYGFFRIVIELEKMPENYKIIYNDNKTTIMRIVE